MSIRRKFNKEFFKKWSPEMSYILGFLFADGNIIKTKRNTHFTSLYTADYDLLHAMRGFIGSNHKISERRSETGVVYVVQIGSKELFNDLILLGLTPNKARRMELPKIPKKYAKDFVRGYFDGDGNVWSGLTNTTRKRKTKTILVAFTSASVGFLHSLFLLLKKQGLIGGSLFKSKKGNYGRLQYSTLDALKSYKIMYNKSDKLFLNRKKLVFEKFMELRP
ncbi:MAG: hypothetical protein AAB683_00785 [Patescibacteria group bacterium]